MNRAFAECCWLQKIEDCFSTISSYRTLTQVTVGKRRWLQCRPLATATSPHSTRPPQRKRNCMSSSAASAVDNNFWSKPEKNCMRGRRLSGGRTNCLNHCKKLSIVPKPGGSALLVFSVTVFPCRLPLQN